MTALGRSCLVDDSFWEWKRNADSLILISWQEDIVLMQWMVWREREKNLREVAGKMKK